MDQSDIEQLTSIFAKLGYDITVTKRKEENEDIIPKKTAKKEEKKDKKIQTQYISQHRKAFVDFINEGFYKFKTNLLSLK